MVKTGWTGSLITFISLILTAQSGADDAQLAVSSESLSNDACLSDSLITKLDEEADSVEVTGRERIEDDQHNLTIDVTTTAIMTEDELRAFLAQKKEGCNEPSEGLIDTSDTQ